MLERRAQRWGLGGLVSQQRVSVGFLSVPSPVDHPQHQALSGLEHGSSVERLGRMLGLPELAVQPLTKILVL